MHRLVGVAQSFDECRALQPHHRDQWIVVGDRRQHLQRILQMALAVQDVRREQSGRREVRPQVKGQAQHQHRELAGVLRAQRCRQREVGLGDTVYRTRHRRRRAGSHQRRQGDRHFGCLRGDAGKGALRFGRVTVAGLGTRQNLGEPQVGLAELDLCLMIELRCVRRAARLVDDHRRMQRVDATEPLALEIGMQRRQGGIGPPVALLRPCDQQWLKQLGQALARQ